jgi:hypothetical protein
MIESIPYTYIIGSIVLFILIFILVRYIDKPLAQKEILIKIKKVLPKKEILIKVKKSLPEIILVVGTLLIVTRLFLPPKYVIYNENRIKVPYGGKYDLLYPIIDFNTVILHSLAIALITGVLFYLFKRGNKH